MTDLYCDSTRHRLDAGIKYSRRHHHLPPGWATNSTGPSGDYSPGTAGHAPVILSLQKLEFLFNAVQGLWNSELEGLACSLVRRLGRQARGNRGSGKWADG